MLKLPICSGCAAIPLREFASISIMIALLAGCGTIHNAGVPDTGGIQLGMASWYGKPFHGRIATSGETYNMYKLTAAHRTLPFGTIVRVTHFENGRTVTVTINDRGPWIRGRVIDLSYAAAAKIGMLEEGTARVKVETIDEQTGIASWYGKPFHGRLTASGEVYDMNQLSAAHTDLPFGASVRVTSLESGEAVTVKVNDRMPRSNERVINLSRRAAEKLGMLKSGTARVAMEVLGTTTSR